MVTLRKFLVCIAAGWATLGMSHWALAHEPGENEATENKTSNNERSEHSGSHNEATERSGASSSRSTSDDTRSVRATRSSTSNGTSARRGSTRRVISSSSPSTSRISRSRDGGTERHLNLRTFVGGRGKADYKVSGIRRSFEVELENTTLQPGQLLSVSVNGLSVGSMTVGLSGRRTKAKFKLSTQLGNAVPTIATGSVITVTLGTATVASATF